MRFTRRLLTMTALLLATTAGRCESAATACADVPHSDHPKAVLSNGDLKLVVFLPDAANGYYRGSRFDWSGVIACATYNGHTYFGEWFRKYDPRGNDSITGPVEEFRSGDTEPGYNEAAPGGLFVKPGVGVLRKVEDVPYRFGYDYPLVDTGRWTAHVKRRSILFKQELKGPGGIAYVYEKELTLEKHGPKMTLRHRLKNVGTAAIDTSVYDHGFFMLDGRTTGLGHAVHFPFKVQSEGSLGQAAVVDGNDIVYTRDLNPRESVAGYLKGFSNNASDFDFTVEDRNTKVGVEETSTSPLEKIYFWSVPTTICPEGYIHLHVEPNQKAGWELRYRFFGPPPAP